MRRAKPEPRKPLWEVVQNCLIAVFSSNLWDILVLLLLGQLDDARSSWE